MARFLCPSGNHEYQLGLGSNTKDHGENEVKDRECGEEHPHVEAPPPVIEEVREVEATAKPREAPAKERGKGIFRRGRTGR